MSARVLCPGDVHYRRISKTRGRAVIACSGNPVRPETRLKYTWTPSRVTCPRCLSRLEKLSA